MAGAAAPKNGNAIPKTKNGGNAIKKPKNGNAINSSNSNKNGGYVVSSSTSTTADGGDTNNGGRNTYYSPYSKFRYIDIEDRSENRDDFDVRFGNEVIVTTVAAGETGSKVISWIDDVYNSFKNKLESGDLVVGLDIEWVRLGESSDRNKVDILQLCLGDRCLIYQFLNKYNQEVPDRLVKFLEDEKIIFVGSGIDKKAHMLWADHGLYVARSEDLGSLADYKLCGRQEDDLLHKKGLKGLAREVLNLNVPDVKKITLSRWDIGDCDTDAVDYLGSDQVLYACLDAYASFKLGESLIENLIELPDPPKKKEIPQGTNKGTKVNQGKGTNQGQVNQQQQQQGLEIGQPRKEEYSVRVDNLPEATRWGNLRDLFPEASRANVALDKETKKSLGYGYVNFEKKEDAEKAIHDLNGYRYEDHILTVGWKEGYSVRVNNLSYATSQEGLFELFKTYGAVRAYVVVDTEKKSKGLGFVNFVKEEDAAQAIEKLNGCWYDDRQLRVGWATPKGSETSPTPPRRNDGKEGSEDYSVCVRNLSYTTSQEGLFELFKTYGAVRASVVVDKDKKSKGLGFVNFVNKEYAAKAIEELNGCSYDDRQLRVGWATPKGSETRPTPPRRNDGQSVRFNNLSHDIHEDDLPDVENDLWDVFSEFGALSRVHVAVDKNTKMSRGFGFVNFKNKEGAVKAVEEGGIRYANRILGVELLPPKEN